MRARALLAAAVLLAAGCGDAGGAADANVVTVLAASSLTESFTRLGDAYERDRPGAEVRFSFGGSSGLAQQIVSGAPADVFAAASPATMKTVTDAGRGAGPPAVFARNQLVIAVPKGNPRRITTPAALAGRDVKVALCAAQVPCGSAAATALAAAGVEVTPVTQEQDVKAALAKVKLGEVDAALVYRTDARSAAAEVDAVEFAGSARAVNDYPVVALTDAPNPDGAAAFVAFVRGPAGQQILADAGFQRP
ncbi:molybdate ABC transporter substrate-binding protein [Jidongwangia harbinensis]|uniref:molybdate ABC transporter substrate-binding protein n=1 Tax=Jidongwangia harbinensis TaxID=2878561 RepID=UPI001CD95853|nr:molybdate ABC transporter substrate-binding protein [Jidongwangia harbinensis]MCA2216446.1 molybdate ABC transporter substrate-binding protein [Jidongwangia harbinensis]